MYISLISTISRKGYEDIVFSNLHKVMTDDHTYDLVFIIDNIEIPILPLQIKLEKLAKHYKIKNITVEQTKDKPPPAFNMIQRRTRIARNHNLIASSVGASNFIFGFEDDTILTPDSLNRLIRDYRKLDDAGFIQGVQVGRWGREYIGAWKVDNIEQPTKYTSLKPQPGLQKIDCGGFYCFLTLTNLYRDHEFKWSEPLGPDAEYTLSLRKQGYQNYIDWDVETIHQTPQRLLRVKSSIKPLALVYNGRWINEYK